MVFLFLRWDVLVPWRVNGTKILEGIKQAATDMVISRQNRGVEVARGATSKTQIEKINQIPGCLGYIWDEILPSYIGIIRGPP